MARSKQLKGFAVMDPTKRAEIARLGGIAAHRKGTAHEWTQAEAVVAGRKGGQVSRGGRGKPWNKPDEPEPAR
jgi:general stress protein YciG